MNATEMKEKRPNWVFMLIALTMLFVIAQGVLFGIHYKVTDLLDSFVSSSISREIFYPNVLLPILQFISIQILAYIILVSGIWFITISCAEMLRLSSMATYWLGILNWLITVVVILALNTYYFPGSFFAILPNQIMLAVMGGIFLLIEFAISLLNAFYFKRHRLVASALLLIAILNGAIYGNDNWHVAYNHKQSNIKPNIIIIGIDSLRPDFLSYFGNTAISTPNIDAFLQTATTFTQAYTPLARTYPAWISILTAQYPKHNSARNNLLDPASILTHATLAQRLQQAGYETIYASDEKRFSNITEAYGFDRIIGPAMGVNDFLLGGLSDFPLSNLIVNLPMGRYLFPYNYANRAAAISYKPSIFMQLLYANLNKPYTKPVFLVVHLCLSHWPFTWANVGAVKNDSLPNQYRQSIAAVDAQTGELLSQLKKLHLLENSLVVLLSDHGTTVGLPHDRLLTVKNYQGPPQKLKWISVERLNSAPQYSFDFARDYTLNTSYGQGNDLLSLKQMHVLLAFKYTGKSFPARWNNQHVSLLDVAPTILEFLHLPPLKQADGISLADNLFTTKKPSKSERALFMETGDSMTEIQTDHIYVEQVLKGKIGLYRINRQNGFLYMDPLAAAAIIKNKQLGVLQGDWLLVRYPARQQLLFDKHVPSKLITTTVPAFYVLANVRTGNWTIGLETPLAQAAPVAELLAKLKDFYGTEWALSGARLTQ